MTKSFESQNDGNRLALTPALVALAILAMTLLRLLPIGAPIVFSDEYSYAVSTKFLYEGLGVAERAPALSNWLYLRVFEIAHVGSGDALNAARILNSMFAAVAGWCVYLLARNWAGVRTAALVAVIYGFLFVGGYAAYFMPEAMFFAVVALLALAVHRYLGQPGLANALLLGVVGALATCVKSHGLLLLPAVLAGMFAARRMSAHGEFSRPVVNGLALVVSWWGAALILVGLLGDKWTLNLLGEFYTDVASSSVSKLGFDRLVQVLLLAKSHVSTMLLVVGFPITIAIVFAFRSLWRPPAGEEDRGLAAMVVALLCAYGGMLVVSVLFTVGQAGAGPYETLTRLHGRYYEHLLLLTAILGVLISPRLLTSLTLPGRWILASISAIVVIAAVFGSSGLGWQTFSDFSLAYGIYAQQLWRYYAIFISLAVIVLATMVPRKAHVVLGGGLLIWLVINTYETERLRYSLEPQAGDRVGEIIATAEAGGDRANVLVISPGGADVQFFRLAFHLLDENVRMKVGPLADSCPAPSDSTEWVVVAGNATEICGAQEVARFDGMAIGRLPAALAK
jgi:hypothetical protein